MRVQQEPGWKFASEQPSMLLRLCRPSKESIIAIFKVLALS